MPGSRNRTLLPRGRLLSLMPQRRISRQSYFGDANPIGSILISPGFSPPRMRIAALTVFSLDPATECIGPPTVSPPKKASWKEKIGAFATAWRLRKARSPSWVTPAASTDIKPQNRTVCGGSAVACFRISSNDRSAYQTNATRFSKGFASLFTSSSQNFSRGEAPMTTAIVCVSGRT